MEIGPPQTQAEWLRDQAIHRLMHHFSWPAHEVAMALSITAAEAEAGLVRVRAAISRAEARAAE